MSAPGRGRLPALMVVVVLVLAVAGYSLMRLLSDDSTAGVGDGGSSTTGSDPGDEPGADVVVSRRLLPSDPPADGVVLPRGRDVVDGYPVGFEYTDLGAAAAGVAVTRAQVGFDADQATEVVDVYADEGSRAAIVDRARQGVANRRRDAGVPESGAVPAPASYYLSPVAFRIDSLEADYYAVSVLSYATFTTVAGESLDRWYSGTQLLTWDGEDWRLVQGTADDFQRLQQLGLPEAVAPGTGRFGRSRWIPLAEDDTGSGGR